MFETVAVLTPILIADVINPVLFAFMVYAAGTDRPIVNSTSLLLGHTAAYFVAGLLVALGLGQVTAYLANPNAIDYLLGLVLGLLLLWIAVPKRGEQQQRDPNTTGALTPVSALGLGAVVNFVGIPFALPYFAAVDQILKADLSTPGAVALLIGYNLAYALPFLVVPALVAVLGERSKPILERINAVLERASAFLMPLLLGLLGAALVADAMLYFSTGTGLF